MLSVEVVYGVVVVYDVRAGERDAVEVKVNSSCRVAHVASLWTIRGVTVKW